MANTPGPLRYSDPSSHLGTSPKTFFKNLNPGDLKSQFQKVENLLLNVYSHLEGFVPP